MVNILWTSGWDSTFRILDLIIIKRVRVQPYYILDESRKSTKIELNTMKKIKQQLKHQDYIAYELLNDLIVINRSDIKQDDAITDSFNNLVKESFIGNQYDWLSRFTHQYSLENIELSVHKDDKIEFFLRNNVIKVDYGYGETYIINKEVKNKDILILENFSFPVLDITKLEMQEIAKDNNFLNLMEMTWFCHNPTLINKPCGWCNPCIYTREEGLVDRVPSEKKAKLNKQLYKLQRIYYAIERRLKWR